MCFEMSPQIGFLNGCIVTVVEIFLTFLHCAFSNVSSNRLSEQMHIRISCIYSTFFHSGFSNVSSNCLPQKRNSRICCIPNTTMTTCGFSNVSSYCLPQRGNSRIENSHICCICLISPHYVFSNVSSNRHSDCIFFYFSPLCISKCLFKSPF